MMSYPVSVKYVFNTIHRFTPSRLFSSFPSKVFVSNLVTYLHVISPVHLTLLELVAGM